MKNYCLNKVHLFKPIITKYHCEKNFHHGIEVSVFQKVKYVPQIYLLVWDLGESNLSVNQISPLLRVSLNQRIDCNGIFVMLQRTSQISKVYIKTKGNILIKLLSLVYTLMYFFRQGSFKHKFQQKEIIFQSSNVDFILIRILISI